jgi:hypothetical protein
VSAGLVELAEARSVPVIPGASLAIADGASAVGLRDKEQVAPIKEQSSSGDYGSHLVRDFCGFPTCNA